MDLFTTIPHYKIYLYMIKAVSQHLADLLHVDHAEQWHAPERAPGISNEGGVKHQFLYSQGQPIVTEVHRDLDLKCLL